MSQNVSFYFSKTDFDRAVTEYPAAAELCHRIRSKEAPLGREDHELQFRKIVRAVDQDKNIAKVKAAAEKILAYPNELAPFIQVLYRQATECPMFDDPLVWNLALARLGDIGRAPCRAVCRTFRDAVGTPRLPNIQIFGQRSWEKYWGYKISGDVPAPPNEVFQIVSDLELVDVEKEAGVPKVSLFLMPGGLSLLKLKTLIQKPKEGFRTAKFYNHCSFFHLGPTKTEKCYWVAMTNGVATKGAAGPYTSQRHWLKEKLDSNWDAPKAIEAAVCAFFQYMSAEEGKYLFKSDPTTYTFCQERVLGRGESIVIGNCSEEGLAIDFFHPVTEHKTWIAPKRTFAVDQE